MDMDDIIYSMVGKEAENIGKKDESCIDCDNTDIRTCIKCGKIRQASDGNKGERQ